MKLSKAKILITNGIEFEHWIDRFVESAKFKGDLVVASNGIKPLRCVSNPKYFDPHAWHTVPNAKIYVTNIANALIKHFPEHKEKFTTNLNNYLVKLETLDKYIRDKINALPSKDIITTHDAFWYFGKEYGIRFSSPLGVSTEESCSPQAIAYLIGFVKKKNIKVVFLENLSNSSMLKQIAKETGAKIGGTLYADALAEKGGEADNYISFMRHNTDALCKPFSK